MKRESYLEDLEKVTAQAQTKWDVEKMRDALAQARQNNERKYEALKRAEFAERANGQR